MVKTMPRKNCNKKVERISPLYFTYKSKHQVFDVDTYLD